MIYPFYVTYVFWKTVLIVKPKQIVSATKKELVLSYYKSKKYYRKAKKFTLENKDDGDDDDDDVLENFEDGAKGNKLKKMKEPKMKRLIKKLIIKLKLLFKKIYSSIWRLFHKVKSFEKHLTMTVKRTIKKLYELWLDTERIVFKIKGLPFQIIDKIKYFIKDAIDEPLDNQFYDHELPKSKQIYNTPIVLGSNDCTPDELIITKTVTSWPGDPVDTNANCRGTSRALVSRGRPQTRQLESRFSDRIDGTLPAGRKYYAPPTNEELIDDYFNTFDAIQPHDEVHMNSVSRRKRKKRIVTDEENYDTINYPPTVPERPVHTARSSYSKNYGKIKEIDESICNYKKACIAAGE